MEALINTNWRYFTREQRSLLDIYITHYNQTNSHINTLNNMLDEITSYAGTSALLNIYSGTQPGGAGSVTTKLAGLVCDASAFAAAAAAGTLVLAGVTADSAADATGTATWFRITQSDTTFVLDGDVSTTAAGTGDLQLDSTSIVLNGNVALGGPNSITAPNAA